MSEEQDKPRDRRTVKRDVPGVPGRVQMREDPRDMVREQPRARSRKRVGTIDKFYIPPELIPPGVSYEWKRISVLGQEDPSYMIAMRENGWEPVDVERVPGMMPNGYKGPVVRDGQMLMERPKELTDEARAEDIGAAREALRIRERQMRETPDGTLTRDHPRARPVIRRSHEPMPVPGDDDDI